MEVLIKLNATEAIGTMKNGTFQALLNTLVDDDSAVKEGNAKARAAEPEKKEKKAEAPTKPEKETKPEPQQTEPVEANQDTPAEETVSLETVRAELARLTDAGKIKEVKELFARFGAKKFSEVKEADYWALYAAATQIQ